MIEPFGTALFLAAVALTVLASLAAGGDAGLPALGDPGQGELRGVTLANTALAGSAFLYLAYLWCGEEGAGRAASALAAGGALGIVSALALNALGRERAGVALFEGTALLTAVAVAAYLGVERAYRNRSAGVLVMPAVMAAVLCEMWLISRGHTWTGQAPPGLGAYWETGHRFALVLGYCPLALAAALAAGGGLGSGRHDGAVRAALAVGAPLLVLAAGLGGVGLLCDRAAFGQVPGAVAGTWLVAGAALALWMRLPALGSPRLRRYPVALFLAASAVLLLARSVAGVGA